MIAFTLASALKDLRRRATDRVALVMWLGIPLLLGSMMALVTDTSGSSTRGVILIADEDGGLVARAIAASLQQGPLATLFDVQRVAAADGRTRVQGGGATALVIVPAGTTRAFLTRRHVSLTLVKNPAQRILPGIVEESLEIVVESGFYVQRILGEPLAQLEPMFDGDENAAVPTATLAALATMFTTQIARVTPILFPPALDYSLTEPAAPAAASSASGLAAFGRLFVPGLVFMSLLFIAQGMSGDLWEEQRQGTLRRVIASPSGVAAFLIGKMLAGAVLMGGVTTVALMLSVLLFDVPVGRALAGLPWAVFGGTVLVALFFVPQVIAGSQRGANMLGTLLVFPLMMIGGSFFPFEAMPAWMAAIGRWTPNGQAVAQLKQVLDGTADPRAIAVAAVAMVVPAVAALAFATRRVRRQVAGVA